MAGGAVIKGDVLSIVEAAYVETTDPDEWLGHALRAMRPHLDRGSGVLAHRFAHGKEFWRGDLQALGRDQALVSLLDELQRHWAREGRAMAVDLSFFRQVYPLSPVVAWVSSLLGQRWTDHAAAFLGSLSPRDRTLLLSRPDVLGIIAGDPSGHGCVFFARDVRASRLPGQTAAMWRRIAAHLVTGYRLARRRAGDPDAVLDPGGKLLHREKVVKDDESDALRDATRAIDRARGRLRRVDPERALELWKGLVAGRWSLVDHFDHDGRRFVMAKRNAIEPKRWPALSEREAQIVACVCEGQPFKLVAYQLGVSTTRIAADLARVLEKIGVRTRLELVAAYRARAPREGAG